MQNEQVDLSFWWLHKQGVFSQTAMFGAKMTFFSINHYVDKFMHSPYSPIITKTGQARIYITRQKARVLMYANCFLLAFFFFFFFLLPISILSAALICVNVINDQIQLISQNCIVKIP